MMKRKLNPVTTAFFVASPIFAVAASLAYAHWHGVTWVAVGLFFLMLTLTLMSISAGYHRLFAHRSHDAAGWLKVIYLLFGAASFQQSCIKWATDHRFHHRYVDQPDDPYNIKKGSFLAHIGWILHHDSIDRPVSKDLSEDPLLVWQQKYWVWLGIAVGFGFPTMLGALLGDVWGGFVFGGLLRMVVGHHLTFLINSLAHSIGSQPYSSENSARDSWITAIFTFGEGYHNFHHWKPGDYRNGVRLYHWDPPKWFIYAMSLIGQTRDLKRTPREVIQKDRRRTPMAE